MQGHVVFQGAVYHHRTLSEAFQRHIRIHSVEHGAQTDLRIDAAATNKLLGCKVLYINWLPDCCKRFAYFLRTEPLQDTKRFKDVCLLNCLHSHGYKVAYECDGPFYAMKDGNQFLKPWGCLICR